MIEEGRKVPTTTPFSWGEQGGLLYRSPTGEPMTREQWLELARDRTRVPVVKIHFDDPESGERLSCTGSWLGVASSRELKPCFWIVEVRPLARTPESDARGWCEWLPDREAVKAMIDIALLEPGALIIKDLEA